MHLRIFSVPQGSKCDPLLLVLSLMVIKIVLLELIHTKKTFCSENKRNLKFGTKASHKNELKKHYLLSPSPESELRGFKGEVVLESNIGINRELCMQFS